MDPFTQRVLQRAEERSKALGISSTSKYPLSDYNSEDSFPISKSSKQSPSKKSYDGSTKSTKIVKNYSSKRDSTDSKENIDLALEINITAGSNVQVQVEVEEKDVDKDGNIIKTSADDNISEPTSLIRDQSRNRLQRLGCLYSDTENLSSPIHRTEGKFHEQDCESTQSVGSSKLKRFGKLAALANTINNWEDDLTHVDVKAAEVEGPPKPRRLSTAKKDVKSGAIPKKGLAPAPPVAQLKSAINPNQFLRSSPPSREIPSNLTPNKISNNGNSPRKGTTSNIDKRLNWDKKVMDALESQGFQRRDSSSSKLTYDYKNIKEDNSENIQKSKIPSPVHSATGVSKPLQHQSTNFANKLPQKQSEQPEKLQQKLPVPEKTGVVLGRAALFENASKPTKIPQKDPAEMSLKERMALFEKNKGTALVPKAPLAISASSKQIMGEPSKQIEVIPHIKILTHQQKPHQQQSVVETKAQGLGIKNTVAALLSSASTISETKINQETKKQRQQEMDQLLNRYTKPKENGKDDEKRNQSSPKQFKEPPPAPPMPPTNYKNEVLEPNCIIINNKRRSGEDERKESNDCPNVRSVLDDVKRIRVNPPKDGRLYPTLSDLESVESDQNCTTASVTESEEKSYYFNTDNKTKTTVNEYVHSREYFANERSQTHYPRGNEKDSDIDSEDADLSIGRLNGSLGREIMHMVQENNTNTNVDGRQYVDSSYTGSDISDVLGDIDEYLDRNDEDDEIEENEMEEINPTRKNSVSSHSFSYQKPTKHVRYETIDEDEEVELRKESKFRTPVKSELTVNPSKDNDMVTLVHTVSFYRKQQTAQTTNNTPVKKVQRPVTYHHPETTTTQNDSETDDNSDSEDNNMFYVQEKVKKLFDEVSKQQTIISQTSQALNLCAATIEFSGSTEAVEGERHLLVATHRRQAALDEIQRLRVERTIRPSGAPKERGNLSINDITVPLKQDYIKKLAADTISGHHLVCLLKYNEHVLASKAIPTLPGLVSVKFPDTLSLSNVYADFKITLEIYGMTAHKEVLPHEVKYHIAMNKKQSKILTPKGKKGNDNRLVMPPVQSPAGPNAVRTPALSYYGFVIFSLREIQRTSWSLNQSSGVSPLEGTIHMKVSCELSVSVDYRGFLTMFEDVSGFGAWHRRWCRLNGHVLSYWKYPDDEKKKTPIGSIDLNNCCSNKITLAPRDVCARLNTMLLEIKRPQQDDDVESLVLVKHGKYSIVRHLLSADIKEEREEWCANLNKSIALLRAWGSKSN